MRTTDKQRPVSLMAVGVAASQLGAMVRQIRASADAMGIRPRMKLNGVDYFTEADLEQIGNHLRGQSEPNAERT